MSSVERLQGQHTHFPNLDLEKQAVEFHAGTEESIWDANPVLRAAKAQGEAEELRSHRLQLMGVEIDHKDKKIEDLEHTLTTDALTGLKNETGFMVDFTNAVKNLEEDQELIFWMMDLDHFKEVNDGLGYEKGDELLGKVGSVVKKVFSRNDDSYKDVVGRGSREEGELDNGIARIHGDELVAYSIRSKYPTDYRRKATREQDIINQNNRLNEELRKALDGTEFEQFDIRLSIGTATHNKGDTYKSIFARASSAMFDNKYSGKREELTKEDREQLRKIVPFLESIHQRVPKWMKEEAKFDQLTLEGLSD